MADYVWDSATQSRLERQVSFFFNITYQDFTIVLRFLYDFFV